MRLFKSISSLNIQQNIGFIDIESKGEYVLLRDVQSKRERALGFN